MKNTLSLLQKRALFITSGFQLRIAGHKERHKLFLMRRSQIAQIEGTETNSGEKLEPLVISIDKKKTLPHALITNCISWGYRGQQNLTCVLSLEIMHSVRYYSKEHQEGLGVRFLIWLLLPLLPVLFCLPPRFQTRLRYTVFKLLVNTHCLRCDK